MQCREPRAYLPKTELPGPPSVPAEPPKKVSPDHRSRGVVCGRSPHRGVAPPGDNKDGEGGRRPPNMRRRRRESNPCTGLCRPLPKPLGHSAVEASFANGLRAASRGVEIHPKPHYRADDGIRTRDPHLGKVMLYQLSHVRMLVRDTSGRSAGSLRRCVRTLSDPRATTNSNRGLRQKICLPNESGSLSAHHLHASRWRKAAAPPLVRNDHLRHRRGPAPAAHRAAADSETRVSQPSAA